MRTNPKAVDEEFEKWWPWPIDPFRPIYTKSDVGPNAIKYRRRAAILANTRRQLAERGYDNTYVGDIADQTNVSVPTIYNLVGKKKSLMEIAVSEHIYAIGEHARQRTGYPNLVISLADSYWRHAVASPDYAREANLTYYPPLRPLKTSLQVCCTKVMTRGLQQLNAEGKLRPGVVIAELGLNLSLICGFVFLDHLNQTFDPLALRRDLFSAVGRALMGAVVAPEVEAIELWIDENLVDRTDVSPTKLMQAFHVC